MRLSLKPHSYGGGSPVTAIDATVVRSGAGFLSVVFEAAGDLRAMRIPPPAPPVRAEGLWHQTCFEAFARVEGEERYLEFNLSPSGEWAAYRFSAYRSGMDMLDIRPPTIEFELRDERIELRSQLMLPSLDGPLRVALSAVVESSDGGKSYWALAHPADKPDFHHPDSFQCELP